ncbi:MAG: response regulator, partial [Dictyoglomus sp.]
IKQKKMDPEEKKDVLIVEDSPTQAEYLRGILIRHNYSSSIALRGDEALEILKIATPKLIISDILMPGIDGYELCKRVKFDERLKNIPFMLLTVLSTPEDIIKGIEVGADGFIVKPFEENYLISTVQFLIANNELKKFGYTEPTMEIILRGKRYALNTSQIQILNLLLMSYENVLGIKEIEGLKKEPKNLYEKEAEYDFLIEGLPVPIIVVRGIKGEIISLNSYASSLFNLKKEEILGKNLFEIINFNPIDYSKIRELFIPSKERKFCEVKGILPSEEVSQFKFISTPIFYRGKPAFQISILKT